MENNKSEMIGEIIGWFDTGYIDDFVICQSMFSDEEITNFSITEKESFVKAQDDGIYDRQNIRKRLIESLRNENETVVSELYQGFYQLYRINWFDSLSNWLKTPVTIIPTELLKYDRLRDKYRNQKDNS